MANLGSTGRYFAHNSAHAFSPVLRTAHKMPSLLSNFFSLWMLQFSHILEPSQPFLANISRGNFPKNSSTWLVYWCIRWSWSSSCMEIIFFFSDSQFLGHEILYYLMHFYFPIIGAMFYIVYFAYKNVCCPWNNVFSLLNCLDLFMRKFNCDV